MNPHIRPLVLVLLAFSCLCISQTTATAEVQGEWILDSAGVDQVVNAEIQVHEVLDKKRAKEYEEWWAKQRNEAIVEIRLTLNEDGSCRFATLPVFGKSPAAVEGTWNRVGETVHVPNFLPLIRPSQTTGGVITLKYEADTDALVFDMAQLSVPPVASGEVTFTRSPFPDVNENVINTFFRSNPRALNVVVWILICLVGIVAAVCLTVWFVRFRRR